jgi:hypothetical protein
MTHRLELHSTHLSFVKNTYTDSIKVFLSKSIVFLGIVKLYLVKCNSFRLIYACNKYKFDEQVKSLRLIVSNGFTDKNCRKLRYVKIESDLGL